MTRADRLAVNSKALFVQIVQAMDQLPASLREHADEVTGLEEHRFDESYIQFLDTPIRLSPRGPEWTERLMRRRAALLPFCGITLLRGRVPVGDMDFTVEIHPETRAVIYWEEYEYGHAAQRIKFFVAIPGVGMAVDDVP